MGFLSILNQASFCLLSSIQACVTFSIKALRIIFHLMNSWQNVMLLINYLAANIIYAYIPNQKTKMKKKVWYQSTKFSEHQRPLKMYGVMLWYSFLYMLQYLTQGHQRQSLLWVILMQVSSLVPISPLSPNGCLWNMGYLQWMEYMGLLIT